jgi:cytochrome c553
MAVAIIVVILVALGLGVGFVAFAGGPASARQAYLTRGRRGFRVLIALIYVACGIAVPVLVLTSRPAAEGASGTLVDIHQSTQFKHGKTLFRDTCWSCHSLGAINARGVTGPNLDQIGQVNEQRVLNAIRIGGTGDGRMPPGLLQGPDARAVAYYVSQVAGK